MPISWSVNDAHAPFIKVIVPWQGYYEQAVGSHSAGESDSKTTEFYYKILVPELTQLDANNCYHIKLDLSVLGSESDEVPVQISGQYHVVDWNETEEMGGNQSAGRYLKVSGTSLGTSVVFDMYSNSLTIPISASGPVVISNASATYPYAASSGSGSLIYTPSTAHPEADNTGEYFMITPDPSGKSVKLEHVIEPFSTSFTTDNAKDIAKITYKFRIALAGHEQEFFKDVTVTQYPSIYVELQASKKSVFVNGTGAPTGTGYNTAYNNKGSGNNNANSLGYIHGNTSYSQSFTIVSVSTLSGLTEPDIETNPYRNWVIGDPRVKLADAYLIDGTTKYYIDRYNTATTNRWLRDDLGQSDNYLDDYLVGDRNADNFIAPKFMLASGWGWNQGTRPWKGMAERCAAYQEDGYPAGRWRLPTEAEILFCRLLGEKGLITNPFDSSIGYFASSGRYITNSGSFTNDTQNHSVRCVYDLWYWGDNKYNNAKQEIPRNSTEGATQWLGFMFN